MFAAENGLKGDPRLQAISEAIRVIPHFPKPGFFLLLDLLLFQLNKIPMLIYSFSVVGFCFD